jgi:hypothetical protein
LLYTTTDVVVITMTTLDLTPQQLKRAAAVKEQIEALNRKLRSLLDESLPDGTGPSRKQTISAATRRKIAAAQRARWAKRKRA